MNNTFLAAVRKITNSPALNIFVGLIFLGTGVTEIWDGFAAETVSSGVGAHHGAVLFGALHALKNLPDLFEGLEYVQNKESS